VLSGALGAIGAAAVAGCGSTDAAVSTVAPPSPAGSLTPPGGTLGLGVVGLFVADLAASLVFYRPLGLAIPLEADTGSGAFRLSLPTGQILFWETYAYTRRDFPDYRPAVGDRKVALEFGFATPADLDATYQRLLGAGAPRYFPPTQWGNVRYAVMVDPDGNQVSLRHPLVS